MKSKYRTFAEAYDELIDRYSALIHRTDTVSVHEYQSAIDRLYGVEAFYQLVGGFPDPKLMEVVKLLKERLEYRMNTIPGAA